MAFRKSKIGAAALCGLLLLGMSSSAFASNSPDKAVPAAGTVSISASGTAFGEAGQIMANIDESGKSTYSTDGGKTWVDGTPEGIMTMPPVKFGEAGMKSVITEDGKETQIKHENGKISYSTDGGKTWIDGMPDGMVTKPASGIKSFTTADGNTVSIKFEDGKTSYSTDCGKTWIDGMPPKEMMPNMAAGFGISGTVMIDADGKQIQVKIDESGKTSYSTDGGKTWTEGKPPADLIPQAAAKLAPAGSAIKTIMTPDGNQLQIKCDSGKMSYSTDGGKTWIDGMPPQDLMPQGPVTAPAKSGSFSVMGQDGNQISIKIDEKGNPSYSTDGGKTWNEGKPTFAVPAIPAVPFSTTKAIPQ